MHTQDLREASNVSKRVLVQQTTDSSVSYSTSSGHLLHVASPAHILHDKLSPQPYGTLPVLAVPTRESASIAIDPILSSPLISTTATSQASNTPQLGNSLQSRHSEEDPWLSSPSPHPFVTAVSGLASTQTIPSPMSLTNLEKLPAAVESRERSPMSQPTHVRTV